MRPNNRSVWCDYFWLALQAEPLAVLMGAREDYQRQMQNVANRQRQRGNRVEEAGGSRTAQRVARERTEAAQKQADAAKDDRPWYRRLTGL